MTMRHPATPRLNLAREEEANRDLGNTQVGSGVARSLQIAFLLTLGFGLLCQILEPESDEVGIPWNQLVSDVPDSCGLQRFESALDRRSAVARRFRPRVQAFLTQRLGRGNAVVVMGRDGWLFHRPSLQHVVGPGFLEPRVQREWVRKASPCRNAPTPDPVEPLARFHRELRERGVKLVVLPIPLKATLHPEALADGLADLPRNPSHAEFVARLEAAGVSVFDAAGPLQRWRRETGGDAFLRTDPHWTPQAVEVVAQGLARMISADLSRRAPRVRWQQREVEVRNIGSLAATLGGTRAGPGAEPEEIRMRMVLGPAGQPWQPRSGASILVLGDSFASIFSDKIAFARAVDASLHYGSGAGLAERLAHSLERHVDLIAVNAGGANLTRQLFASQLGRDSGRPGLGRFRNLEVVVLEFSEIALSSGRWSYVPLPR